MLFSVYIRFYDIFGAATSITLWACTLFSERIIRIFFHSFVLLSTLELQCEPQRCERWASLELIFGICSIYNLSCELHRFLLASYQLSISAFPLRILKNLFTFFGFCLLVGLFLLLCVSFPFFHRLRFSLSLSLSLRICSSLDYFVDLCAVAYVYDFSACYLVIVGLSVFIIVHTHTHSHSTFNFHWRH